MRIYVLQTLIFWDLWTKATVRLGYENEDAPKAAEGKRKEANLS